MARKKQNGQETQSAQEHQGQNGSGGTRKPPVHEVRLGRIKAAVWENPGDNGEVFLSVTFSRSYKDKDGQWRSASSYSGGDILVLSEVARLAFLFVTGQTVHLLKPLNEQPKEEEEIPI